MLEDFLRNLTVYGAVALVFAAFTGLGTLPAAVIERAQPVGRQFRLPLLAVAGWGIVAIVSAILALADLDQTWPARAALGCGLLLLLPFGPAIRRQQQRRLLADLAVLLVLLAPMGVFVAGKPATAFDEFAQWLPNTRYLVDHGRSWFWPDWLGASSKPGYPNGSVLVALLTSQLIGPTVEAPFKLFTVILLGGFGMVLAGFAAAWSPPDPARPGRGRLITLGFLATGVLIAFIDPFVDPRISLTALADTSTAVVIALAGLVACLGVGAARRGAFAVATSWFAWTGLLSLTLVMVRTTNLVLVAGVALACGILVIIARAGSTRLWLCWGSVLLAPAAAGVLVWNLYLRAARIGADMAPRAPVAWDWAAPLTVLRVFFLDRLTGNPVLAVGALVLVGLALIGGVMVWRRLDRDGTEEVPSPRLLLALTGIVGLSFIGFLAWAYAAVFSAEEVARAASLWRYLTELGPLIVMAGFAVLFSLMPRRPSGGALLWPAVLAAVACGLVLLLPLVGRSYYDLACRYPDVFAARRAALELEAALEPFRTDAPGTAPRVAVVNPTMGDWMAYAVAFDLRWPASDRLVQFRRQDEPLTATEAWAWDQGLQALLDFRALDRPALFAQATIPSVALLGRPAAEGEPWRVLATTAVQPLPSCSFLGAR